MALRKLTTENNNSPDPAQFTIRRLQGTEHWAAVSHMYRNYPGVDPNFDQVLKGRFRRPFMRWIGMPLYFWLGNKGYGLWLNSGELAGQLFLQHRRIVTHINDIEVNRSFQGRGLSHELLSFAEQQARHRRKAYLTLAVTLANERAANLYRKSGYLEQHHTFFFLSRPWWSESAPRSTAEREAVRLVNLHGRAARRNLDRFFEMEIEAAESSIASVWKTHYRPELPQRGKGFSFALYWGTATSPAGHADFFDWDGRGRWRLYIDPNLWGTGDERALFETLLRQAQSYGQLGLMVGSRAHHRAVLSFSSELGLVARDTERMLMIRPLSN